MDSASSSYQSYLISIVSLLSSELISRGWGYFKGALFSVRDYYWFLIFTVFLLLVIFLEVCDPCPYFHCYHQILQLQILHSNHIHYQSRLYLLVDILQSS